MDEVHDDQLIEVTVLRANDPSCPDGNSCPAVTRVKQRPGRHYLIAVPETDPAVLAAHASRMGPGEVLVWQPDDLVPEVDG